MRLAIIGNHCTSSIHPLTSIKLQTSSAFQLQQLVNCINHTYNLPAFSNASVPVNSLIKTNLTSLPPTDPSFTSIQDIQLLSPCLLSTPTPNISSINLPYPIFDHAFPSPEPQKCTNSSSTAPFSIAFSSSSNPSLTFLRYITPIEVYMSGVSSSFISVINHLFLDHHDYSSLNHQI